MRKLFLLFSLSLGLTAMAQNGKYTLNISIPDSVNLEEIYLYKIGWVNSALEDAKADTIKIEGKKASISGKLSDVKDTPLASIIGEGLDATLVVFEEGTLEVAMSDRSTVKGALLNDRLSSFRNSTASLEDRLKQIGSQFRDNPELSNEEKQKLSQEATPLANQLSKAWLEFTKTNMENPLGQFFALSFVRSMQTESEINDLIAAAPAEFKANSQIVDRLAQIKEKEEELGIGKMYKDITLASPEGVNASLSDYIGKNELVLIDFWASWCGPCIKEMPTLVKAYEQFKGKGFEIVGLSLDSSKDAWTSAIRRLNMTWVHMSDLKGWDSKAAQLYQIQSIPQTLLVNKEGKVVAANLRGDALIEKIGSLLNK